MAESIDIRELNERIERQSAFVTNLTTGMDQIIVGQKHLVESLLIGLLSDGHSLRLTYCQLTLSVRWFTVRRMKVSK